MSWNNQGISLRGNVQVRWTERGMLGKHRVTEVRHNRGRGRATGAAQARVLLRSLHGPYSTVACEGHTTSRQCF